MGTAALPLKPVSAFKQSHFVQAITIIVMACLFATPALANDCAGALTSPDRAWLETDGDLFPAGPKPSTATVRAELAPKELREQGFQFVVRRIGNWPWLSTFSTFGTDIQGDPRAPFILLGKDVAQTLGFAMPDQNTIYLPNADRINLGIEILNAQLPPGQQIHFRFYEQNESNRDRYLQMLAQGLLPLAGDRESVAVHDYSFHVAAILLSPAESWRLIGLVNDIAVPFLKSIKDESAQIDVREWWERELDQSLGFPTLMLGQIRAMRRDPEIGKISPVLAYTLGLRAAPRIRLEKAGHNRYDVRVLNSAEPRQEVESKRVVEIYTTRRKLFKAALKAEQN